jgi:diadenylate cyclase
VAAKYGNGDRRLPLRERLSQFLESLGTRDAVEIAILAVTVYFVLRLLGRTRGAGLIRGLGLVLVGLFLVAQVLLARFDLTVLGRLLDYLLTTTMLGLIVIFQPELRRGLMLLGRYRVLRLFVNEPNYPVADKLADAAGAMARECVGALIAIERDLALSSYIETGEAIDAEVSSLLLRSIFCKRSPLHDGAVILAGGRLAAAACQLPLGLPPEGPGHLGMRHRAALALSEETDAVLIVVSEETGRISLAVGGQLELVPRENLSRRLVALLSTHDKNRHVHPRGPQASIRNSAA